MSRCLSVLQYVLDGALFPVLVGKVIWTQSTVYPFWIQTVVRPVSHPDRLAREETTVILFLTIQIICFYRFPVIRDFTCSIFFCRFSCHGWYGQVIWVWSKSFGWIYGVPMYVENNILISLNFKCPMTRKWIKETITGFKISSFERINHQIVKYTMYLSLSGIIWVISRVYRVPKFPNSLCHMISTYRVAHANTHPRNFMPTQIYENRFFT